MTVENKWTVLMQRTQTTKPIGPENSVQEEIEPLKVGSQKIIPESDLLSVAAPNNEEDNPFMSSDDATAIDTIQELIHSDDDKINMPQKAILRETLGITAVQIHGDFCESLEEKYHFKSKTKMFDRKFAAWLYVHSCGYKGQRAQQAFEAVKAVNTQNFMMGGLTENGGKSKKDKLLGR